MFDPDLDPRGKTFAAMFILSMLVTCAAGYVLFLSGELPRHIGNSTVATIVSILLKLVSAATGTGVCALIVGVMRVSNYSLVVLTAGLLGVSIATTLMLAFAFPWLTS
jgi:hypothetical protein